MCSVKNVFLEISQNSQENTCARDFFKIKLQAFSIHIKTDQRGLYHKNEFQII